MSDKQLDPHRDDPRQAPDGELPDALRWQLRALRRDTPPARDLWSGIAGRLGEQASAQAAPAPADQAPQAAAPNPDGAPELAPDDDALPQVVVLRPREASRRRWFAPMALAASVAVLAMALGLVWKDAAPAQDPAAAAVASHDAAAGKAPASLVQREADGMTRQYQAALREIEPATQQALALKPTFDELDRNTALILDAMARDPDSRLLLEQLRRTYARRLALAQRVAYT